MRALWLSTGLGTRFPQSSNGAGRSLRLSWLMERGWQWALGGVYRDGQAGPRILFAQRDCDGEFALSRFACISVRGAVLQGVGEARSQRQLHHS